jgi:hypothetical protein
MDRPPELQLIAQLAEQTALLREIRDLLQARLPTPAPSDERLERLLVAIAGALDSDEDFSSESLGDAGVAALPGSAALARAIVSICGKKPKGGLRRLGHFLARNAGREAGGFRLFRVSGGDLPRYKVSPVSNRPNPGRPTELRDNANNRRKL